MSEETQAGTFSLKDIVGAKAFGQIEERARKYIAEYSGEFETYTEGARGVLTKGTALSLQVARIAVRYRLRQGENYSHAGLEEITKSLKAINRGLADGLAANPKTVNSYCTWAHTVMKNVGKPQKELDILTFERVLECAGLDSEGNVNVQDDFRATDWHNLYEEYNEGKPKPKKDPVVEFVKIGKDMTTEQLVTGLLRLLGSKGLKETITMVEEAEKAEQEEEAAAQAAA